MQRILSLDTALSLRLTVSPNSIWRRVARLTAHVGDGQYVFGVLGLLYVIGWLRWNVYLRWATIIIAFTVLMAITMVTLIKFIVRRQRPRPPGEFVVFHYDVYSFPSGHSARLAALAGSTALFFPTIGWLLGVIAITVGLARIAVGIHYASDVVAGLGLGILVAWTMNIILPILPIPMF